ncbi:MAG: L,D-transpeptidase family protein [Phycisphaerae bacterium]|nr:L,D-transpeptidase family protein [Phycisphaerae bacterium]
MALPSQLERSSETSRPVMARSGRRPAANANKVWIGAAMVLVVAGAVFGVWKLRGGGASEAKGSTGGTSQTDSRTALNSTPDSRSVPPVSLSANTDANKAPVTVEQKAVNPPPNLPGSLTEAMTGRPLDTQAREGAPPAGDIGKPGPVDLVSPPTPPSGSTPLKDEGFAPPTPSLTSTASSQSVRTQIEAGDRAMAANKLVEARTLYSKALLNPEVSRADADVLRSKLTAINENLVFSPNVTPGDGLTEMYTVVAGDALERIRRKRELSTEWMLIQRVNKLTSPNDLKVGQKLKLVRGPFHAVVDKSDFRLDLFAGSPDDPESWLYIRSYRVGLGESNGTPLGVFVIRNKQKNPPWTNPRTGEKFAADDPKNPIGEFWLGWQGVGDSSVHTGFGIHGTIEPDSIGQSRSMGCVRMLHDDIAQIYEMLAMKVSTVRVVP